MFSSRYNVYRLPAYILLLHTLLTTPGTIEEVEATTPIRSWSAAIEQRLMGENIYVYAAGVMVE